MSGVKQPDKTTITFSVWLKVMRTEGEISDLSLKRPSIVIPSPVTSSLQVAGSRRIGFLKLQSFNARAQQDLVNSIHELEKKNITELVLDLRDNRGGLVQEGIEVAKVFLDGGLECDPTKQLRGLFSLVCVMYG